MGKFTFIPVALLAMLLGFAPSQMAQEAAQLAPTAQVNGPVKAPTPQQILVDGLPQAPEQQANPEAPRPRNPNFSDAQWNAAKASAAKLPAVSRPEDGANVTAPSLPSQGGEGIGIYTPGAFVNFAGGSNCGFVPSDMGLAVTNTWVLQVINACVYVYNKSGTLQPGFPKSLDSVLGWPSGTFTYDPRATYDFVAGRFIITAATQDSSNTGYFNVAASDTGNPTGSWHVYHLSQGSVLVDYPTLGQNWANDAFDGAIYTCANIFPNAGGFTNKCLFLPKAAIYAGSGFSYYTFSNFSYGGTVLDTIQPVNVFEPTEKPRAEFAVNSLNTGGGGVCGGSPCNGLVVWAFANTLVQTGSPGPVVSGVHIATPSSYSFPANADNATFCTNCIETLDNRISGMVHYSAGRLFPSIDVGNGGTSAVLGWVVRPFLNDNGGGCTGAFTNACPTITGATVEQEFCDYCGAGHNAAAFFGAIVPTTENNWTMFATFSSQSLSPGLFYTSNRVTWQTPLHDSGVFACQANHAYGSNTSVARWGDYNAAAPQGIPKAMDAPATWGSGMYVFSANVFGTCIAANKFVNVTDP